MDSVIFVRCRKPRYCVVLHTVTCNSEILCRRCKKPRYCVVIHTVTCNSEILCQRWGDVSGTRTKPCQPFVSSRVLGFAPLIRLVSDYVCPIIQTLDSWHFYRHNLHIMKKYHRQNIVFTFTFNAILDMMLVFKIFPVRVLNSEMSSVVCPPAGSK